MNLNILTQNNNSFLIGSGKWIRNTKLGQDDEGAMDGSPEPEDVRMP